MHPEKQNFTQSLGYAIRKHRIDKKYSIEYLALKTGLDYSHLSKIERGLTNPSAFNLKTIATVLEVPVCKLINDTECPIKLVS